MEVEAPLPAPPPASCWSTIVKKTATPAPSIPCRVFRDCKSSKGIAVAVVDASAIIHGDKLSGCADKFVSVREVVEEVRDPVSRQRLTRLPFFVETMEPSLESVKKVVNFARETGDLQTLSDVDIKLIALTYMLEVQIHGGNHLRASPPQFHAVNVKTLPEAQMPGWGNNVPNLAEWEALDQALEGESMVSSKILPLKNLDDNTISTTKVDPHSSEYQDKSQNADTHRKIKFLKKEFKHEGNKMVAEGVDASNGEINDYDEWHPAVSRSTYKRLLKRKGRLEANFKLKSDEHLVGELRLPCTGDEAVLKDIQDNSINLKESNDADIKDEAFKKNEFSENIISSTFEQMSLNFEDSEVRLEGENSIFTNIGFESDHSSSEKDRLNSADIAVESEIDECEKLSENLEVSSNGDGSMNTSFFDDASSKQSWMMCSLPDSTIACITSDYAMQNVILQIGLRLLAPGGMQIRQLHRWVLKCHACNNVTQEIGKIFCPRCGNGGTLRKVSVTVGGNAILLASRRQRTILRGTKFSLPLPQGGRDAITKNLILREDQLPHKLLYPKTKKKAGTKDEGFLCSEDIFSNSGDKRGPLKPPVRKAVALFSGKRNPNDNHFSRKH